MKTTLVIMAAGIGSRFGTGIKQMESVGPSGELIIDYSIHDAMAAGFERIVFVIKHEIEADFKAAIGDRLSKIIEVKYAYQELTDLPEGYSVPEGRVKPWGTGQAVLSCKGIIDCPFVVINADDFYGRDAFQKVHDFLVSGQGGYCMAGFYLENTLSDNGSVTRGICKTDEQGFMVDVKETRNIVQAAGGNAEADGVQLSGKSLASMNMWGLQPQFLDYLEQGFVKFLQDPATDDSAEYLLPEMVGAQVRAGEATVRVLPTDGQWYGVTYAADKPVVVAALQQKAKEGLYPNSLWG